MRGMKARWYSKTWEVVSSAVSGGYYIVIENMTFLWATNIVEWYNILLRQYDIFLKFDFHVTIAEID